MIVKGKCKICKKEHNLDIDDMTPEEAKKMYEEKMKDGPWHCDPGWHMEIVGMANFVEFNWETTYASI